MAEALLWSPIARARSSGSECFISLVPGLVRPLDPAVLGKLVTKDEQQRRAEIVMRILDGETVRPIE